MFSKHHVKSIYISGPYTAETEEQKRANIERANEEAQRWARQGYFVYCPHTQTADWEHTSGLKYEDFLAQDIYWLSKCDTIALLPGWEKSKGAYMEYIVARGLGLRIVLCEQEGEGA